MCKNGNGELADAIREVRAQLLAATKEGADRTNSIYAQNS